MLRRAVRSALTPGRTPGQWTATAAAPTALFAAGEQGFWYDPSDLTTLFQDSSGATPVTAVGQVVGLMLDKSKGITRGAEELPNPGGPFTATTQWTPTGAPAATTITVNAGELQLTNTDVGSTWAARDLGIPTVVGEWYEMTVTMRVSALFTGSVITLTAFDDVAAGGIVSAVADSGSLTHRQYRVIFRAPSITSSLILGKGSAAGDIGKSIFVQSASLRRLPGNHASQATAASRPVLQQDSSGFLHLAFDGVDDGLATPGTVDFSATDKVTVFAGLTKLSDATRGFVFMHENVGLQRMAIEAPNGTLGNYSVTSGGSLSVVVATAVAAPNSSIITLQGDIAGDSAILRRNGAVANSSVGDQGTGTFSPSGQIQIGKLLGGTFPFNGRLYSLIGTMRAATATELTNTERHVGRKMGLYF